MNTDPVIFVSSAIIASALTLLFFWIVDRQVKKAGIGSSSERAIQVLGKYSPVATWGKLVLNASTQNLRWLFVKINPTQKINTLKRYETLLLLGEVTLICVWGLWVGHVYLNFDPAVRPGGREFLSSIQTHYVWDTFQKCGTCMFWNGFNRGGAPAFAELHGSLLYPLVIITTLILGAINGAKLTLVLGLIMGGLAQWWLAKIMGFGRVARVWAACIAIAGGHLSSRMELGAFGVLLSTAACSLVLAPAVGLAITQKRRYAILLGLTLSLALISGQGYMQVSLIICILPALLIFVIGRHGVNIKLVKELLFAGVLSILLSGVFLVPLLHFYPNIVKETDENFHSVQPLAYIPLNEVIDSPEFYNSDALGKLPHPYMYINFIGWIPVLLAFLPLKFAGKKQLKLFLFFVTAIILVYLTAGAVTLKLIALVFPMANGVRFAPQIAGMANPLILALSAWGLDGLIKSRWPRLNLQWAEVETNEEPLPNTPLVINTSFLVLAPLLVYALFQVYQFSQFWLYVEPADENVIKAVQALITEDSEWVDLPFGEHFWVADATAAGLKVSDQIRAWDWQDRQHPPVNREATTAPVAANDPNLITRVDIINVISHPENQYASISNGTQNIACKAIASGGNIDVTCPALQAAGTLIVEENNWSGWYAYVDGQRVGLFATQWLSIVAPAGQHTYQFRYQPWDVWVGILMTLSGILLCICLWGK